jgi:alkylhydroperoxidase family enzyme
MRVSLVDHRSVHRDDRPGAPPPDTNLHRAIANVPAVADGQRVLVRAITDGMDARLREMTVLQFAARSGNDYCWGHHVVLGARAGLSRQEIADIFQEATAGFSPEEQALLALVRAVHDREVDDRTWAEAARYFGQGDLIRFVMLCGFYCMMTVARDALAIPLDPGLPGFELG